MRVTPMQVHSNLRDYEVRFEENTDFIKELAALEPAVFIVDEKVLALYGSTALAGLPPQRVIVQPAREELKNLQTVCALYERIMSFAARKNLNLVSIGGGIIQDITGFVASTLYRGLRWHFVPTTLLAQVDSCIGAKTSLNFNQYKNLVGTFYPPQRIYIFPGFLPTLTECDFYSGVGEMAKLHIMNGEKDAREFVASLPEIASRKPDTLLRLTAHCLEIKKGYIESDEFDAGRRNMLNYGHCFGHAIESATDFAVPHGQAVVLGMLLANREALKRGILKAETEEFVRKTILVPVLKSDISKLNIDVAAIIRAMGQDKKNVGKGLALVMLADGYQMVKITDLTAGEAEKLVAGLKELIYD